MSTTMNSNAVADVPQVQNGHPKPTTLKGWIESEDFKRAIAMALPKHMTAERFCRIAITATMRTPKLMECTRESVFNCLLQLSQLGLEPDGRTAHLIPFENSKKNARGDWSKVMECTLVIDYKGFAELVMRSGLVSGIHADTICEHDDFEYDRGQITRHRIDFRKPRGTPYAAYVEVRMKDGNRVSCVMSQEEIYSIRDRSQGWIAFKKGWAKKSPWNPAEPFIEYEMWKKTAFRRLTKWLTLSPEIHDAFNHEDNEERRLENVIVTERVGITDQTSKSDMIADMLSRQSSEPEDIDQSESGHEEIPGDVLREQLENAKAATEQRHGESVPVGKQTTRKPSTKAAPTDSLYSKLAADIRAAHDPDTLQRINDDILVEMQSKTLTAQESESLSRLSNERMELLEGA
jgi:recombination protein RecT